MKKLLALFLCIVMICSCIPTSVFAEGGDTAIIDSETVEESQEPTEPVEEPVADISAVEEPTVKATPRKAEAPAWTEEEVIALAEQSWDVSEAQDGSITMYLVPNEDNTKSLYSYGDGVMESYSSTDRPQWDNDSSITSVSFNHTGTIGSFIFYKRDNLLNILIKDSITTVGSAAFAYCTKLKDIVIPDNVLNLGARCFYGCSDLISVSLGAGIKTYEKSLFYNCTNLTSVSLSEGVTTLEDWVFRGCSSLKEIKIPNSVVSLGNYVFDKCHSLENVTFGSGLKSIGELSFCDCFSLDTVTLPKGVQIGNFCFQNSGVKTVVNLENASYIGYRAFIHSNLSGELYLSKTCKISACAFDDCPNLSKVTWKGSSYNVEKEYVHEDIILVNQESVESQTVKDLVGIGLCVPAVAGTIANTLNQTNYNIDEIVMQMINLGLNSSDLHTTSKMEKYYSNCGLSCEKVTDKQAVINALSEGKLVFSGVKGYTSPEGRSVVGHCLTLYGISKEGYIYVLDPIANNVTNTLYDPSLFFSASYGAFDYGYIVEKDVDLNMKTSSITASASVTEYPESYIFNANEGEKVGITNDTNTYLGKSSDWTSYEDGKASTSMRFAYTPEPVDYIYVLDYSDSMTKSTIDENYTNMSIEKTIAYEAIEDLLASNGEARVSVVNFRGADEASYTEFTSNPEDLYDAIADATCQGFTSYADGFNAALEAANSRTGDDANRKTVVVFVSDGDEQWWINDEASGSYLPYRETKPVYLDGTTEFGVAEATTLREAGAEIYSVILNPAATETAINNMAGITGDADKVYTATTIGSFAEALVDIVDSNTIRSFVLTDTIGEDFNYNGNLTAANGTTAVIDEANRTITWTLENILPNTEYTLSFDIQSKKDSSGQFVCGDLPTNLGNAVVKEGDIVVNEVETPVLHRDSVLVDDGAQAHMIHKYTDLKRADNPALYTDGIRFVMDLDMKELQDTYEPGDKLAFGIAMLPLDKLQNGQTTNYLTMNVGTAGQLSSNGSYTFVNNTSAISSSKKLAPANMITWTEAMENCTTPAAFANLLKAAGMNIFDVTDTGIQYSVYMMFSNANTRQAQADREIAYRGIMVSYDAQNGYAVKYSFQRNNSATRIYNHYNCINYNVINVKGATAADMLHGESEYNPSYEAQAAAQ